MRSGDIIKHEKFMDVAVLLTTDPMSLKDGGYHIKGLWMNQAFTSSFIIDPIRQFGKVNIKIKEDRVSRWSICENPEAKCVRYEKWSPISST